MSKKKKYTLKELREMVDNPYSKSPLNDAATEHASDYDYESDTLDAEEAVCDAFVYGAAMDIRAFKRNLRLKILGFIFPSNSYI